MQIFFTSLGRLEQFTRSLDTLAPIEACEHCSQCDQFVSHGFVHKGDNIVGKRILCSNRNSRNGCGRTRQLYLDSTVPRRRYAMRSLLAFVVSLIKGTTAAQAYHHAVGHHHHEPRQAWRWLDALMAQMGQFRSWLLSRRLHCQHTALYRTRRLNTLLPTLNYLFDSLPDRTMLQSVLQTRFL